LVDHGLFAEKLPPCFSIEGLSSHTPALFRGVRHKLLIFKHALESSKRNNWSRVFLHLFGEVAGILLL
jgi:hypothetical protein